jgi:hypothetical protein
MSREPATALSLGAAVYVKGSIEWVGRSGVRLARGVRHMSAMKWADFTDTMYGNSAHFGGTAPGSTADAGTHARHRCRL